MSTPCKYVGADLACVGINTNDTIDVAFQKLAEYVCALNLIPTVNDLVHYSESALGAYTGGTSPTYSTLANSTYTIPTGSDGDYEINYVGQAVIAAGASITFKVYKNGVAINAYTHRTITSAGAATIPFSLFLSNLTLVATDIITVKSTATNNATTYPVNCILKITKIA